MTTPITEKDEMEQQQRRQPKQPVTLGEQLKEQLEKIKNENKNETPILVLPRPLSSSTEEVRNNADDNGEYEIPRRLVFTSKHNMLITKEPANLYNNVMRTIEKYNEEWGKASNVTLMFLDSDDCVREIKKAEPKL